MREPTTEANNPIEQEFLSVIREYERVIYKVCYLYTHPNAPLNDLYRSAQRPLSGCSTEPLESLS